jgi:hypothetical protein
LSDGRTRDALAAAGLVALASVVATVLWSQPVRWMPDGYFYRALVLRVRGAEEPEALRRVFQGPLTAVDRAEETGLRPFERKLGNPEWVRESAQFYERRWVVPILAAPLEGRLGDRGLRAVSLAGYVVLAPLLYLLLRLWLPLRIALPAAAVLLLVEPLRTWSSSPLTDSWGLVLATAALAFGCLALTRGPPWLVPWTVTILVLGFTRDLTLVLAGAAALAALVERTPATVAFAATGVVAALPAPLLFGAPLKAAIAYPLNGYYPVDDPSWSYIADRYVGGVKHLVKADLGYLAEHPFSAGLLVAGTIALVLLRPPGAARTFVWAAVPAALAYLFVTPNDTDFRLELAFLPLAALGLGAAAMRLDDARGTDRRAAPQHSRAAGR